MSRWRMHKLGFVNFWLYDVEEFPVEDGRILLRGANASGKSITTQSFIPFLMDGNRSPERLDPFGTRERKMEFYLLGDGDREESTGYLYLEYKKQGLEEYAAVCVGMRAQKGKSMDFWGFCLCDGRRIGLDFPLYRVSGGQRLPLSKLELKNQLADGNNWAESPGAYKQLVNERLYQFRDIKQYDQLIQLLIKVRAPKLSNNYRPSVVKALLEDSLQVLTDEDLSAMSSAMERMDGIAATLESLKQALKDAQVIRTEYTRYNQFVLGRKAQAYLEARGETLRLQNAVRDGDEACEGMRLQREALAGDRKAAAGRVEQAKAQLEILDDGDLKKKGEQLTEANSQKEAWERRVRDTQEALAQTEDRIRAKEAALRDDERLAGDAAFALAQSLKELDGEQEILELPEHGVYREAVQKQRLDVKTQQAHQRALSAWEQRVLAARNSFQRIQEAEIGYDEAAQFLEKAFTAVQMAKSHRRDAEQQEQTERDRLLEAFALRQSVNWELRLDDGMPAIRQAIAHYRAPADWEGVRRVLHDEYSLRFRQLTEKRLATEKTAVDLEGEEKTLTEERDRIRSRPEPVPPRSSRIEATRAMLAMRGIPCAAFYETVDFGRGLSPERRAELEMQLADTGVLDALVVPDGYRDELDDVLRENPDRFLLPGDPVADPITELVPDGQGGLAEEAGRILAGISCGDLSARTAFLPDGTFRHGALCGRSAAEGEAGYIGVAARRTNRERQLRELEDKLSALSQRLTEQRRMARELSERLQTLEKERVAMPTASDLDQALDMLETAGVQLRRTEEEREQKALTEQETKRRLDARIQESRELCRDFSYARTPETYTEALEATKAYGDILSALWTQWQECERLAGTVRQTRELLETLEESRDESFGKRESESRQLAVWKARLQELQEFLARPENRETARRITELGREIDEQTAVIRNAELTGARLEERIQAKENDLSENKDKWSKALIRENTRERYFAEDVDLCLTLRRGSDSLAECAAEAQKQIQAKDRDERTMEGVYDALNRNFHQHNSSLADYQPKLVLQFDPPESVGDIRQRHVILLQMDGKAVSLYDFIEELSKRIAGNQSILEEQDRELFEDILADTLSHKLRARIEESQRWSLDMSDLMGRLDTSMGLNFSLEWKEKKAEGEDELDTAQLVKLLNKDRALLTREDNQKVTAHFRAKVSAARQRAEDEELPVNYADLIRKALDYRRWFEFRLYFRRKGEDKKELSDRAFGTFSGGEKAMAMYLPQFAAMSAQYKKAGESSPRLVALDEAFAGVDGKNIGSMFELVQQLDFDYIMNSPSLWGCYPCVPCLDIAEFYRPGNSKTVTLLRYRWNGQEKTLLEE